MSGEVRQNTSVATGVIAVAPTATESASDPAYNTNPEDVGSEWHNTTTGEIFICNDNTTDNNLWVGQKGTRISTTRALFGGGYGNPGSGNANMRSIDYFIIDTIGNATDFGDLVPMNNVPLYALCASDNGTNGRGLFFGGSDNVVYMDTIQYVNIASTGGADTFGYLSQGLFGPGACSNATNDRVCKAGGVTQPWATSNVIEYVTASTLGNATDLGDLTVANYGVSGTSNGTNDRGIVAMGSSRVSIDYFTISTTGNASDFGDVTAGVTSYGACFSNGTDERGIFAGGSENDEINYITITTPANATDFGDLSTPTDWTVGTSSGSVGDRGLIALGYLAAPNPVGACNIVEYITISSTGNSTDFGDFTGTKQASGGCSNSMT
jgi:hypothetical protein